MLLKTSKIAKQKEGDVLRRALYHYEKEKHVPYMVQRKHFDQTFSKSLMVQVHGGTKASAEEGRFISTQTNPYRLSHWA